MALRFAALKGEVEQFQVNFYRYLDEQQTIIDEQAERVKQKIDELKKTIDEYVRLWRKESPELTFLQTHSRSIYTIFLFYIYSLTKFSTRSP